MSASFSEVQPRSVGDTRLRLFSYVSILLLVTIGPIVYLRWANSLPPREPDSVVLPQPNGFDACLIAIGKLTFMGKTAPHKAAMLEVTPALRRALAQDRQVLDELRRALRLTFVAPPVRSFEGSGDAYMMGFPDAALSFVAESRVALADKQYGLAIDRALDAIELGSRLGGGGALDANAKGRICSVLGVIQAEKCVRYLSAQEARAAGQRLERVWRQFPSFADAVREERKVRLASIHEVYTGKAPVWVHGRAPSRTAEVVSQVVLFVSPKPWRFEALNQDLKRAIAYAGQPWPQRPHTLSVSNEGIKLMVEHGGFAFTTNEALLGILRLELSLQEFRQQWGRYPQRLAELSPRFLRQLPRDPFSNGPLVYRAQRDAYQLYSLGPDGRDDKGDPVAAFSLMSLKTDWHIGSSSLSSGRQITGDLPAGMLGGRETLLDRTGAAGATGMRQEGV